MVLVLGVVGLVFWTAGIRIARFGVAVCLGLLGAAVVALVGPRWVDVVPMTAGLVGFAGGVIVGILAFRWLQGGVLAVCVGVAVAGIAWHHPVTPPTASMPGSLSLAIKGFEIPVDLFSFLDLHVPEVVPVVEPIVKEGEKWIGRWSELGTKTQWTIVGGAIVAAFVTFLISLLFPRHATWVATAVIGTVLIGAGVYVYEPGWVPVGMRERYLAFAGMVVVGMLVQYVGFWPRRAAGKPAG